MIVNTCVRKQIFACTMRHDTRCHAVLHYLCGRSDATLTGKVGKSHLKAPNLVLDCSFCCWVAWPRFTEKECFSQTPVSRGGRASDRVWRRVGERPRDIHREYLSLSLSIYIYIISIIYIYIYISYISNVTSVACRRAAVPSRVRSKLYPS